VLVQPFFEAIKLWNSPLGGGIKITNTVLFFDDDHPEYAAIFDELVSACDSLSVDMVIEGADDMELLPKDFMKELSHPNAGHHI
jgi:hypothetical protein